MENNNKQEALLRDLATLNKLMQATDQLTLEVIDGRIITRSIRRLIMKSLTTIDNKHPKGLSPAGSKAAETNKETLKTVKL